MKMKPNKMPLTKRILKTTGIVFLLAFVLSLIVPLPVYVEAPGMAAGLQKYIKIDGKKPKIDGQFMITSVYIWKVNGMGAIMAALNPTQDLLTASEANGGTTSENSARLNQVYMETAVNEAKAVAFKKANVPFERDFKGIYVMGIQDNSNFKKYLHLGDTVTKIDGKQLESAAKMQKYIRKHKVGAKLTLDYTHDDQQHQATAKTVGLLGLHDTAGIGIALTDNVDMKSDIHVIANMGDMGGPSGGLMFSLEMYDALAPINLANGRKIAGTGTIDAKGNVGEIGGIDKKILAAKNSGAQIFFAPYVKPTKKILKYEEKHMTNYQLAKATAKKYAPNLKVVPVKTFNEAVKYLETHR
ncbi:MAG: PDZ domain-containing protein [Lactobacillaceae bacterium]|jgi:PDZ domain-containing protein|nr:PDZ domain-containing protein [Lactobacillaceae bacterium]